MEKSGFRYRRTVAVGGGRIVPPPDATIGTSCILSVFYRQITHDSIVLISLRTHLQQFIQIHHFHQR